MLLINMKNLKIKDKDRKMFFENHYSKLIFPTFKKSNFMKFKVLHFNSKKKKKNSFLFVAKS